MEEIIQQFTWAHRVGINKTNRCVSTSPSLLSYLPSGPFLPSQSLLPSLKPIALLFVDWGLPGNLTWGLWVLADSRPARRRTGHPNKQHKHMVYLLSPTARTLDTYTLLIWSMFPHLDRDGQMGQATIIKVEIPRYARMPEILRGIILQEVPKQMATNHFLM